MPKLSENQQAAVDALKEVTTGAVKFASKAAWKKACPAGVSVNTASILKMGAIITVNAAVSSNGKLTELFAPAPAPAPEAPAAE